ncbi:glycosyltransferase [Myceligenerans cantabricum]
MPDTEPVPRPAPTRPRIFTYPYWTSNPYMQMLHLEVRARGHLLEGTSVVGKAVAEMNDPGARGLVHLQWPSDITEQATSPQDAADRVSRFLAAVRTAQAGGRKVLWTVHNVLPHDAGYPAAAIDLHRGLAELADAVHVLSPGTAEAVADDYVIPAGKIVVLPHSSYHGVYGRRADRAAARTHLGGRPGATGVLFFGQMRPYKGLDQLFEAARRAVAEDADVELLLAGKPAPGLHEAIAALAADGVPVTSALRFIADEEVATWFSATDVAVLPYRKILNSGTMHLAATYGVPTVLPDEPHLRTAYGDEPWVRFFDPGDPTASISDLITGDWHRDPVVHAAALAFARHRTPTRMARDYARLVARLGAGS